MTSRTVVTHPIEFDTVIIISIIYKLMLRKLFAAACFIGDRII